MGTRSVLQYRSPTRRCSRALRHYAYDWHGALQRLAALVHSCAFASAARHAAARATACALLCALAMPLQHPAALQLDADAVRIPPSTWQRPSQLVSVAVRRQDATHTLRVARRSAWRAECGAQHAWTGRTIISYRHSATRGAARSAQQLGMRRENPLRRVSYSAHSGVCAEQCTAAQRRFCNVWCTYDVCIACRHPHVGMTGNSATLCTRTRAASAIKRS